MRKIAFVTLTIVTLFFSLKSVSASDPITGKWNFVFDTEGGPREFNADLKLDGDKVTGRFADKADVKGTFKEQKLNLAFPFQSDEIDVTDTLTITGTLEKGALSGDWSFSQYSGTYKAHRN
jgi:hypothetical protein